MKKQKKEQHLNPDGYFLDSEERPPKITVRLCNLSERHGEDRKIEAESRIINAIRNSNDPAKTIEKSILTILCFLP